MVTIPAKKLEVMQDLKRFALENYSTIKGMDYAVETFDFEDWMIIVYKSKGDFAKAIKILKDDVAMIADYAEDIESTAF